MSCLNASKAEIQGVKNPYPTPTRTLTARLRPNHIPNNAGSATKIASFREMANLFVLHFRETQEDHVYEIDSPLRKKLQG